jgi:hypothetical protein
MVAPKTPGTYQSNWKIRNPKGDLLGIGPNGSAPFWVRIEVFGSSTTTPAAQPSITPSPVIYTRGVTNLVPDTALDLDTGTVSNDPKADLLFTLNPDNMAELKPQNGGRIAFFGPEIPTERDCQASTLGADPVRLDTVSGGDYLCYRTNQGLPGYAHLTVINLKESTLGLEFLTWAVP